MKRVVFRVLATLTAFLAVLLVTEAAVRVFGLFESYRSFSEQAADAGGDDQGSQKLGRLLHPYRGWMARPGRRASFLRNAKGFFPDGFYSPWALDNSTTNDLGYLSLVTDYHELTSEQYVIGILGGSVASQLATMGGDAIERRIVARRPDLEGKVVIFNCASGAYKQPQQLFALSELLLLGVPFDIVVNVDGVNEVSFGTRDARDGYHPILPARGQYQQLLDLNSSDPPIEAIVASANIYRHQQAVARLSTAARESLILHHSEVFKTIVGIMIQRHERAAVEWETSLQSLPAEHGEPSIILAMTDPCLGPDGDCGELVAALWERGSRLMAAAADRFDVGYLHVLQPNQYVEGSKVLSPEELEIASDESSLFAKEVPRGYPLLRQRGQAMVDEGISFHDLSMVFRDRKETIYVDTCCHYNYNGYQALGEAIADLIIASQQVRRPPHQMPR